MAVVAPTMAIARKNHFMQAGRFLFFRFRVDAWWWGCALLLRSLLMSFAPVIATDDPRLQMVFLVIILTTSLAFQIRYWPWKVPLLNVLDAVISVALMLAIAVASSFIMGDSVDTSDKNVYIIFLLMALGSLVWRGQMGTVHDAFLLRRSPDTDVLSALFLQTMSTGIVSQPPTKVETLVKGLPIYDLWTIERLITIIEQSGALPGRGRVSWGEKRSSIMSNEATPVQAEEPKGDDNALPVDVIRVIGDIAPEGVDV